MQAYGLMWRSVPCGDATGTWGYGRHVDVLLAINLRWVPKTLQSFERRYRTIQANIRNFTRSLLVIYLEITMFLTEIDETVDLGHAVAALRQLKITPRPESHLNVSSSNDV